MGNCKINANRTDLLHKTFYFNFVNLETNDGIFQ